MAKLAVATGVFGDVDVTQACAEIRQAGVGRVMLSLDVLCDDWRGEGLETTLLARRQWLDRYSLECVAVGSTWPPATPDEWLARWHQASAAATALGAAVVIVPADGLPCAAERAAWLRAACDEAATCGLKIALRGSARACPEASQLLQILGEVSHRALGAHFDTGEYLNINPLAQGEIALQRIVGRLASLGLQDSTRGAGDDAPVPLGQGAEVDFVRTLQIIRDSAFSGPCIVDRTYPAFGRRTRRRQIDSRQWLADSLDHLRSCGWSAAM